METIRTEHLSETEIEEIALARLTRAAAPAVFEHLLTCDHCATSLEAEQDFLQHLRVAVEQERVVQTTREPGGFRLFRFPAPALAAVAALALLLVFVPSLRRDGSAPQTLDLAAYRGSGAGTASAGAPLTLRLDNTGIDRPQSVRVHIVDANGGPVWTGVPETKDGRWIATTGLSVKAGTYWVRVIRPEEGTPLREFQLIAK